jgi:hypothetical protein
MQIDRHPSLTTNVAPFTRTTTSLRLGSIFMGVGTHFRLQSARAKAEGCKIGKRIHHLLAFEMHQEKHMAGFGLHH